MKITLHQIKIRELCSGYQDLSSTEEGIVGYNGLLNIRPKYQREFVYDDKKRNAVIDTVWNGFPLNVMYWVKVEKTGNSQIEYELLDGQQRTISICSFIAGEFMMNIEGSLSAWDNLTETQRERILDYPLQIYICENGTDEEKLKWFNIINIAGERLTEQEIRNAIYSGTWVTEAKKHFSRSKCVAYQLASDYISGKPIRQDYLETALKWISDAQKQGIVPTTQGQSEYSIEAYMAAHKNDTDADELWQYFQNVIHWIQTHFTKLYKKEMQQVDWGLLYNVYKDTTLTATHLGEEVKRLMMDSDVQKKSGIFWYVFDGDEHHLGIRAFDDNTRREVYEKQKGICLICGNHFDIDAMDADHITPWVEGGHTVKENCQMLCRDCNRRKWKN